MSSCDQLKEAAIKSLAKHWNDDVTVSSGILSALITDTTGTDHLTWTSSDLSTSYAVVGKGKESPTFSVTREACQPIDGKNSSPRLISCDDFATTADWSPQSHREYERLIDDGKNVLAEKMLIDSAEGLSSKGDQSWRTKSLSIAAHTILIREIKHWGVLPILICDSVNAQNLTA